MVCKTRTLKLATLMQRLCNARVGGTVVTEQGD